jgi:PhnB protein
MKIEPYLFFNGRCDEAIAFYQKALGAQVQMLMRFKESPDQSMVAPGTGDKVMHATLKIGDTQVMASDGRCEGHQHFDGFALSVSAPTLDEAKRLFETLGEGGQVQMPLTKTFFSPGFGMLADRFGVSWMVIVA